MEFRLESYGPADDRVLRYLNGIIIKENEVQHYFTLIDKLKKENKENENVLEVNKDLLDKLKKVNSSNWNMPASSICMAATLSTQKEVPLEWDESKIDQSNGYVTLSKIKGIFDHLNHTKSLQLSHTVTKHENKTLKYSIFSRNERLNELSGKTKDVSKRILTSLNLQIKFLEMIKEIKREFKVMVSHRNPVDLTSLDVDYPTSFSINVLFFDISYTPGKVNLENYRKYTQFDTENVEQYEMEPFESQKENVWDLWELHKTSSPFSPQQCLVSYYESEGDELLTRLTFPSTVSHFVENNYGLSINSSSVPLFDRGDSHVLMYHLRRARACLIDRLIFCILAQYCYSNVRAGRQFINVGNSRVFIDYLCWDSITLMCEGVHIEVAYRPCDDKEKGDPIWKLIIAKLRDTHINNWKIQKFLLHNQTHNLLGEFIKYASKLIRYRKTNLSS